MKSFKIAHKIPFWLAMQNQSTIKTLEDIRKICILDCYKGASWSKIYNLTGGFHNFKIYVRKSIFFRLKQTNEFLNNSFTFWCYGD